MSQVQNNLPGVMVLHLTLGCNSACRHCTLESDKSKLSLALTDKEITSALYSASLNDIRIIELSGGEPFLRLDLMRLALSEATRYGFMVFVATNAFWATSQAYAHKVLSELKGLGLETIQISADSFHAEFVPMDRVKIAISESIAVGLEVQVSITDNKAGRDATIASLDSLAKYSWGNAGMALHNTQPPCRIGRGVLLPDSDLLFDDGKMSPMECSHFERHSLEISVFPGKLVSFCCGSANPRLVYQYPANVSNWLADMGDIWETDPAINWMWNRGLAEACIEYYGLSKPDDVILMTNQQPCNLCFEVLPRLFQREDMIDIRMLGQAQEGVKGGC